MLFDYSKLKGRIAEKFKSRKALADSIGMTTTALSNRLNGKVSFKPEEIMAICAPDCLDIAPEEVHVYFFALEVLKVEP